jgi:hypothetical protein
MLDHGQKVPCWMMTYAGLDNLGFARIHRQFYLKIKYQTEPAESGGRRLQGREN